MPPRRTLLLLPLLLAAVGCRELLWQMERADETAHRNVGALMHRAAWLTVPRYQEPSGFSSTYREHLDRFDATHPNPAFVPQAGVGRTRPVHGIRGPVEPAAWNANAVPAPSAPDAGLPPAPSESRAPQPQSKPVAARVPTAGPAPAMRSAPRTAVVEPVATTSATRSDDRTTTGRTGTDDELAEPQSPPREELLGRIRWSRLFSRAETTSRADAAARPAPVLPAESVPTAPSEPVAEDERRVAEATSTAPPPVARGPFRALLDRLVVAPHPPQPLPAPRDDDDDADDEEEDEDWDEADLFDETRDVRPTAATRPASDRK